MPKTISIKQVIIFAVLALLAIVGLVALLPTQNLRPSAARASAQRLNQPAVTQTIETAVAPQSAAKPTSSKPQASTTPSTPSAKQVAQPAVASIQTGQLVVHARYDVSGNACGIGPVGTCFLPFPNRVLEIQDLSGGTIQSQLSDVNGNATFVLPAGTYKLVPGEGEGIHPLAYPTTITVVNNQTTETIVDYWAIATTNAVQL